MSEPLTCHKCAAKFVPANDPWYPSVYTWMFCPACRDWRWTK